MSDALLTWLDLWGEWLDELLASGIATPGQQTRQRMQTWIRNAETLGYQDQVQAAQDLLAVNISSQRRSELYYQLLVEQDLLQRLYDARVISERYEGSD